MTAGKTQLGVLPQLLGFNLRRAEHALSRDFERAVGDRGIRRGMFSVLMLVEANPGIAQVDLAGQLDLDQATIVALVDRLEKRRWVVRRRSTEDRRRHGIHLTGSGRTQAAELRRTMLDHEERFRRLFTRDELGKLIEYLHRIHPL